MEEQMDVKRTLKFKNGLEMLLKITEQNLDLYNRELELYVFGYNEYGSIAAYHIANEDASRLAQKAAAAHEYWSAFLGPGGAIYDSLAYKQQHGILTEKAFDEALEYCNNCFDKGVWVLPDLNWQKKGREKKKKREGKKSHIIIRNDLPKIYLNLKKKFYFPFR